MAAKGEGDGKEERVGQDGVEREEAAVASAAARVAWADTPSEEEKAE